MKYFVFDLDGTLVDSHGVYFNSLRKVFGHYKVKLTDEDKKEVLRIAVRDRGQFFSSRLGPDNEAGAMKLLDSYLAADDTGVEVFDGIKELLAELKSQDAIIALWTAREMVSAHRVLEHTRLQSYFSFHMSGTCVAHCKPDPEGLLRIATAFECDAADLIMVGDHDNDMLAAKACGAKAIRAFWNDPENATDCKLSDVNFKKVTSMTEWLSKPLF